jgi:hypothetical protein
MPSCTHCSSAYCKGDCKELRAKIDEVFGPEIARRSAMPKKRDNGEQKLQIATVNWFRTALPDVLVFAVPNGGDRSVIEAALLKKMGVAAGVSDLLLFWTGWKQLEDLYKVTKWPYHAAIELKNPSGRGILSDSQKGFSEKWTKRGGLFACCKNGDEIEATVKSWGLIPKYPFPRSLSSSGKQMRQFQVTDELLRRN